MRDCIPIVFLTFIFRPWTDIKISSLSVNQFFAAKFFKAHYHYRPLHWTHRVNFNLIARHAIPDVPCKQLVSQYGYRLFDKLVGGNNSDLYKQFFNYYLYRDKMHYAATRLFCENRVNRNVNICR
ncbi:hypothetical protein PUN28_017553 [Cardiocondyla obscurior]|uniref:Uncharacterized protein n=1 Tax=Cardiocondyla obscurior TaxID=286306 RepID=A0AAW2EJ41_9HYME